MFRHDTEVTAADLRPLTADLAPDGSLLPEHSRPDPTAPGRSSHLNFDQILRRCGYAWLAFLQQAGDGVFGTSVIVPRLEVDYLAEVRGGSLTVTVGVLRVGTTSFRLGLDALQDGLTTARVQVVLVVFDYRSGRPAPLTGTQHDFLARHILPAGPDGSAP